MPAFAALLRGINVGTANRLPMADLRQLMTSLGYTDVATLLNSGNAVFRSPTRRPAWHAAHLREAIANRFGVDVPVIVKSAAELSAIVAENPLARAESDPSRVLVAMAQDGTALTGLSHIVSIVRPPEQFIVGKHAAYFHAALGIHGSKIARMLLGKAGKAVTTRNWATLCKVVALGKALET